MSSVIERPCGGRLSRGARWLRVGTAVAAPLLMWPASLVSAQDDIPPLEDIGPSGTGMPGRAFGVQVLQWLMYGGIAVCIGVMIYGGATWAGFGSASTGRAVQGKTYAIGGLVGAAVVALAPRAVQMMVDATG